MHAAKRLLYALVFSIVPFEMTFTRYFSSRHHLNIISTILFDNKAAKNRRLIYNYCTNLLVSDLARVSYSNFSFLFSFNVNISSIDSYSSSKSFPCRGYSLLIEMFFFSFCFLRSPSSIHKIEEFPCTNHQSWQNDAIDSNIQRNLVNESTSTISSAITNLRCLSLIIIIIDNQ